MKADLFLRTAIVPAFGLLPSPMDSAEARAMCLAICLQETNLLARHQYKGTAVGFAQFERPSIQEVLEHRSTTLKASSLCQALTIAPTVDGVYDAIEFNDLLCAAFSRLLLWTSHLALPGPNDPASAWTLYEDRWKPGKPRPNEWPANFAQAWNTVSQHRQTEVLKA